MRIVKEIFESSEATQKNDGQYEARNWFNENWHGVHERVNELQRVVREKEPILLEKKYLELTTLEKVQMSQSKLAYYGDTAAVEKEFVEEPPTDDAASKDWCYERKMAYDADAFMRGLLTKVLL